MRTKWLLLFGWTLLAVTRAQAQFDYITNADGVSATITGYDCSGSNVTIPSTLGGLSVTIIGTNAFSNCVTLNSIVLPDSVINIEDRAFYDCQGLYNINLGNGVTNIGNFAFSGASGTWPNYYSAGCPFPSIAIPDSVVSIGDDAFYGCNSLTNVTFGKGLTRIGINAFSGEWTAVYEGPGGPVGMTEPKGCPLTSLIIPDNVTSLGGQAFLGCMFLTNVTVGSGVTSIGSAAFLNCSALTLINVSPSNPAYSSVDGIVFNKNETTLVAYPEGRSSSGYIVPASVTNLGYFAFAFSTALRGIYFQGNAPIADSTVFEDVAATVYYLPGTTGWGSTLGNLPTALWTLPNPTILNSGPNFGVQSNGFGFSISWDTNRSVVIEACTNLGDPVWQPLQTNALTSGTFYFKDSQWTNYPGRFYRVISP